MKAVVLTAYGPPEVLQLREVDAPVAKEHDVLIRVRAVSVNFGDLLVRNFAAVSPRAFHMPWLFWLIGKLSFGFRGPRVRILGSEFSGTVEAVGARVTQFKRGDAVFGYRGPRMGAYAEVLCMRERGELDRRGSCCLPVRCADGLGPAEKDWPAARTAGPGRGRVRWYRPHGRPTRQEPLRRRGGRRLRHGACGVREVVGRDDGHRLHPRGLRRPTRHVRHHCRHPGQELLLALPPLAPHGRLVFVSFKTKQVLQMLWTSVVGDQKVTCAVMRERQADLITVRELLEAGTLRPIVDRVFPLDQAAQAHRYAESGAKQGAVVISVAGPGDKAAIHRPSS